jgi:SNF2 family DNA or RNA helicase
MLEILNTFRPVHRNRKMTEYSVSARHIPEVLVKLRGVNIYNIHEKPAQVQKFYLDELAAREHVQDLKTNGPRESCVVNEHLTLMQHQQLGRELSKWRDRYCFFFDTRTGKTPLSLSIIYDDLQKHPDHKWLIICPLILIKNAWLEDAATFVPDIKIVNCHASTKDKRIKAIKSDAQIYVTNTESFVNYKEYFDEIKFEGCFVDESSDMKSHKSKQGKAIVDFAQNVKRFYLLSGTPAPNGEWEYYRQLQAIDYYCVHPSWTQFKEYYFVDVSFNQFEELKMRVDRREEFEALLNKYAIYVDKEDVLDTPGREFIEYELELPDALKVHYKTLKNELYVELSDEKKLTAPSAAAKLNKLNQLTSGFIIDTQAIKENKFYGENQTEVHLLDMYRFEALKDLLAMHGDAQVLIWANYRREFEIISEMLGDRCATLYGATSLADKNRAIQGFKSGDIQYLIANPASADKGLTLTNCHICVYFSLNWSYELFKQSMERIYGDRRKQPKKCIYYIMIAKGTVDGVLYRDVLQGKGTASMAVLNHLKGGL